MKRTLTVFLFVAGCCSARTPKWLRIGSAAAVCALSAADMGTTAYGHGEANPWLRNANNGVRWPRAIGMNAGLCAGSIAAAVSSKIPDKVFYSLTTPLVVTKGWVITHNAKVLAGSR